MRLGCNWSEEKLDSLKRVTLLNGLSGKRAYSSVYETEVHKSLVSLKNWRALFT